MRVLCEHLHVPKARPVEFKANCINFRCELYLLSKTRVATNEEIHEANDARILFFLDFVMTLGVWGPPGSSFEEGTPPAAMLVSVSFQNPSWGNFARVFTDASKPQKILLERNAWFGRCWAIVFTWFLASFLMFFCCCPNRISARFFRICAFKGDPF